MGRLGAAAIAVACGVAAACLYLTVLLGSPGGLILVYLTQLPLFAAGLWLGAGAAALAGLTATAVMLAVGDLLAAALFAALNVGPVVLLVRQALLARRRPDGTLEWYAPGLLAAWLSAIALAGIVVALLVSGGAEGMQAELREAAGRTLDRLTENGLADRDVLAAAVATVVPGVIAASWMAMAIVNASLAQGLLARFGANWRPSPDLATLTLPRWPTVLLGLAAAATVFGGASRFLGINTMIALFVPFSMAGLAVLHTAARRLAHPRAALVAFYALAGLFGWPLLIVALIGVFETWLGLRRRLFSSGANIDG